MNIPSKNNSTIYHDVEGFSAAKIDVVIHATEDRDKILQSIENLLAISINKFSNNCLEGHWGNRINFVRATIDDTKEANALAIKIIHSLNKFDRLLLLNSLDEHVDEKNNLYFRLDKQNICKGKISLTDNDAIKIRFSPIRKFGPGKTSYDYRRFLLSSIE
jgi:RNA binding exosome subunit